MGWIDSNARTSLADESSADERMIKIRDVMAVGGIVVLFMAVAEWRCHSPGPSNWLQDDFNFHLGGEYDEIARAIRSGRGFSDPFREPSGPTAWMPPVLPYFMAGLYWLTGDNREGVLGIILGVKGAILVLTGLLVVHESRRLRRAWLGYAVLTIALAANFYELFQITHDTWLVLLLLDLLWMGSVRLWTVPQGVVPVVLWGAFGGCAALCSPVVGGVWAAVTFLRWFPRWGRNRVENAEGQASRSCKPLVIAALCSILVITPWIVRCRVVMGQWIPIKSNGAFELWQSQCVDDDGVLDVNATVEHPWSRAGDERRRYLELGEIKFVAAKWPEYRASVAADPGGTVKRILRRFWASCVYFEAFSLRDAGRVWPLRFVRAVYALPLLSVVIVLALRKRPLDRQVIAAMWVYGFYLMPYVLVSYSNRYVAPLVGIRMLLVVYGIDTVVRRIHPSRPTGGELRGV